MKLGSDKGHSKVIHHVKGHLKNQIKSKGFYQLCKSKGFFATHLYSVLAVYYYLLRTPKKIASSDSIYIQPSNLRI